MKKIYIHVAYSIGNLDTCDHILSHCFVVEEKIEGVSDKLYFYFSKSEKVYQIMKFNTIEMKLSCATQVEIYVK